MTDILINVATTVEPNTDWLNNLLSNYDYLAIYILLSRPFGNDNKNHIRELATIPHWTDLNEWRLYMKNKETEKFKLLQTTQDDPPSYSEVTLNPNYLKI